MQISLNMRSIQFKKQLKKDKSIIIQLKTVLCWFCSVQ